MGESDDSTDEDRGAGQHPQQIPEGHEDASAPKQKSITQRCYQYANSLVRRFFCRPVARIIHWLDGHDGLLTALATVAIAFLTWFLATDSQRQAATSRGQLKAIEDQLEVLKIDSTIRKSQILPSMKFVELSINPTPDYVYPAGYYATAHWQNIGQTDAVDWRSWSQLAVIQPSHADQYDFTKPTQPFTDAPATTIGAGESQLQQSMAIPQWAVTESLLGQVIIIYFGGIEWRDIFPDDPTHYRMWCVQLLPHDDKGEVKFSAPLDFRSECNRTGNYQP